MIVDVDGVAAFASTGGVDLTERSGDPLVLLVHGAGMDSSVWQLQTRYLANRGLRAVAVDLPAHGRSEGSPLVTVEAMAEWTARFIRSLHRALPSPIGVHIVGHSMGTFIALELARMQPSLVASLTLCGTATAMPVHPDLLGAATHNVAAASALMASWGHDRPAHVGVHPSPGMWMLGGARALVDNSKPGVLAADFSACVSYGGAVDAAASVTCPVNVVIGSGDKMTPPKSGRALAASLATANVIELSGSGHMMMFEDPRSVRFAIVNAVGRATSNNDRVSASN